ncbi:MAG: Coenzyme F420 hydrogenase/dehydrogenase, beta subunit C-terminal domain [Methanomicrobiales archaeon]|nr:Coenzyme F420 hydrogenase/dehydrogenase, beta subunit C-terminal domain [Methanomicrobiales archaeon]
MARKSYLDLKKEVWEVNLCTGCGACVAVCPADSIYFGDKEGSTHPCHNEYCKEESDHVLCGACVEVCPRANISLHGDPLGTYRSAIQARATFDIPASQSGGAVTAILKNALDKGLLDAVIMVTEDPWTHRTSSALLASAEELVRHAGSRYSLGSPLLAALKEAVITHKYSRLGVVGLPCAVQAARRMKVSRHPLVKPFGNAIRLIIGLFCTESFDYRCLVQEKLTGELGIASWEIRRFEVKGQLDLTLMDGTVKSIPLSEIEGCVRPGCIQCIDFAAADADISAGSSGAKKGYTTLLISNEIGEGFYRSALLSGLLEEGGEAEMAAVKRLAERKETRPRKRGRDSDR